MAAEGPSTFAAQLRRYREAAGLSQEDLAERAGLTAAAIGALERGVRRRPFPHTVQLLAAALNLDEAKRAALIAAVPSRANGQADGELSAAPTTSKGGTALRKLAALPEPAPRRDPAFPQSPQPAIRADVPAFVGRQAELAALQSSLSEVLACRGSIAMLVGEAGIGKTRLAREFAESAASQGALVLWGCCFEGDWQPPYGPWAEALGAYIHDRPAPDLRRELGAGAAPIARLVPDVMALLPDLPLPSPLSPDEERVRLYDAIIRFLLTLSGQRPILLVLDDLHWADPDSLRLLRHLVRSVGRARVLVLGAYRDPEFGLDNTHPLIATLSVLRRESHYERILIRGFTHEEVAEYLAQASGQALPGALVGVIEKETSGNPFYAREVLRHLTEESKLLQRGGRWTTDLSIRELGIPEGVRQVVGRRVAHLSEDAQRLLRLACGFSGSFGFEVLQALSELAEQALLDCLDEALQAGLIRASGQAPPGYEFAHAIVRHTLYDGLNPDRKARLHRRIALALERLYGDGRLSDAGELAWQYHASTSMPGAAKGVPYALRAAEQAKAASAHERAADLLRMARDLAAESPLGEQAEILRQLAIAEAQAVRLDEASRTAIAVLEAMSASGVEPRTCAGFVVVVVRALKDGGADSAVWEPLVERGLALAGGERDLLWARLVLLQDHFESIHCGQIGGRQWLRPDPEAVAIARAEGDEEDYARSLDPLDWRTREETDAVLDLARRKWSRPSAIMRALNVAARDLLYRHSEFREARSVCEELLEVSERFGSIPSQGEALAHLVIAQIANGDLHLGKQTIDRAAEVIARLGAGHWMHNFAVMSRQIGFVYFLGGDWEVLAAQAVEYATGPAARRSPIGVVASGLAVLSASMAGKTEIARALLDDLTSIVDHGLLTAYGQNVGCILATVAVWELRAKEYAPTYRRLVLDLLRAEIGYAGFGPLELAVARMAALVGDYREAEEYFKRARSRAGALGLTHCRPIVDYDQACTLFRAGLADRNRILKLLDSALDGFQAHGMRDWARRGAEQKRAIEAGARWSLPADLPLAAGLTAREVQVLRLIAAGLTNKEIATRLVLSLATVERHIANIYGKIGANKRFEAIAFAQKQGLGPEGDTQAAANAPDAG